MSQSKGALSRIWATLVFFLKTHRRATFGTIVVILGVILFFQNTHPVRTNLYFWSVRLPLVVWALIWAVIGYLAGKGVEWGHARRIQRLKESGASPQGKAGSQGEDGHQEASSSDGVDS